MIIEPDAETEGSEELPGAQDARAWNHTEKVWALGAAISFAHMGGSPENVTIDELLGNASKVLAWYKWATE
jgi:hypothetical protein